MEKLKKIVGQLENSGSCFLVDRNHILTARHCVESVKIGEKVQVDFKNISLKSEAILLEKLERPFDFALLKLEEICSNFEFLELIDDVLVREDSFITYGYPENSPELGRVIQGTLDDVNIELQSRIYDFEEIDLKVISSFVKDHPGYVQGLSGSPIVVDNQIVGIAISSLGDGIGVQKISNFTNLLDKYNINYSKTSTFREKILFESRREVIKNIESKKFLPECHIEISEIKDKIRCFSDPILFFKQFIYQYENLDYSYLNLKLSKLKIPELSFEVPKELKKISSFPELNNKKNIFINLLKTKIEELETLNNEEKFKMKYTEYNNEYYKIIKYRLHNKLTLEKSTIEKILEKTKIIESNLMMVLNTAGQGKTNLLCDCVDNVFRKKRHLCTFLSAYNIGKGDIFYTFEKIITKPLGINFENYLKRMDYIAKQNNKKALIIIDGLNENESLVDFSKNLENFFKKILKYPNISIIFSCRTEYFEERFKNLSSLKNQNNVYCVEETFLMRDLHLQDRALKKYFEHFNIKNNNISPEVKNKLLKDPLLLRFFCEAYKGKILTKIKSLYKYDLFETYIINKRDQLKELYPEIKIDSVLDEIARWMLENNQFHNVPLDKLNYDSFIRKIIYEDVILKEDLVSKGGRYGKRVDEVISFTFDEFRDYIIAWYIIDNYKDVDEILKKIDELDKTTAREGVARYIYFIAKEENKSLYEEIKYYEWTNEPFLEWIFLGEDSNITDEDLKILETIFSKYPEHILQILFTCLKRKNDEYVNLNISTIFEFIKNMDEKLYISNFLSIFQVNKYNDYINNSYFEKYPINNFVENVKNYIYPKNIELAYQLLLITIPTPYEYDTYYSGRTLLKEIHAELGSNANKILDFHLKNSKNYLFAEFVKELKENKKIEGKSSYLFRLIELIKEEE